MPRKYLVKNDECKRCGFHVEAPRLDFCPRCYWHPGKPVGKSKDSDKLIKVTRNKDKSSKIIKSADMEADRLINLLKGLQNVGAGKVEER